METKDVVAGLGEIGTPILRLISRATPTVVYDINPKLVKKSQKNSSLPTRFLHICIPFNYRFTKNVEELYSRYEPKAVVIHSTISPKTTENLQKKLPVPVIYSAIRGVHRRMLQDLKRYTKFFALDMDVPNAKWASSQYQRLLKRCGVKTRQMSLSKTLELAKIVVDTSYYGWLINYAQISNMIAQKHGVDYDEMWSFADEIHKYLGNRPKMFPGFIGGHCIIPNLDLISDKTLDLIKEINSDYAKILSKRRKQGKKY